MFYNTLVLDLDGTLTDSNKEVSPRTREVLIRAQQSGVRLILASGRATAGVTPIARLLEMEKYDGYLLTFNGARTISCRTGETVRENTLPPGLMPGLYAAARENKLAILTYADTHIMTETPADRYVLTAARADNLPVRKVTSFTEAVSSPVPKCLIVGDEKRVAPLEDPLNAAFTGKLYAFRSEPYFLEVTAPGVDKARALAWLAQSLQIDPATVMACGDGYNDITMLRYAGLGVAMGNARPEVKRAAGYVTLSNDHEGVARAVEKFIPD